MAQLERMAHSFASTVLLSASMEGELRGGCMILSV